MSAETEHAAALRMLAFRLDAALQAVKIAVQALESADSAMATVKKTRALLARTDK